MASSFRGALCTKRSKSLFGTQSCIKDGVYAKNVNGFKYFCKKLGVWLGLIMPHSVKVCENTTFKQIIRNLHKFVILIFFFFKIVVLKAACDSKPVSNFSHLHQRSFFRKSRSQMFLKIVVPKNFANLTGKHQCWSLFLIKFQALVL